MQKATPSPMDMLRYWFQRHWRKHEWDSTNVPNTQDKYLRSSVPLALPSGRLSIYVRLIFWEPHSTQWKTRHLCCRHLHAEMEKFYGLFLKSRIHIGGFDVLDSLFEVHCWIEPMFFLMWP